MAVGNGLQIAIGFFPVTSLSGISQNNGISITGQPIVNRNFQYTYYYLKKNHIAKKNPAFPQNPGVFATPEVCRLLTVDPRCRNIINKLDVIVVYLYLK